MIWHPVPTGSYPLSQTSQDDELVQLSQCDGHTTMLHPGPIGSYPLSQTSQDVGTLQLSQFDGHMAWHPEPAG